MSKVGTLSDVFDKTFFDSKMIPNDRLEIEGYFISEIYQRFRFEKFNQKLVKFIGISRKMDSLYLSHSNQLDLIRELYYRLEFGKTKKAKLLYFYQLTQAETDSFMLTFKNFQLKSELAILQPIPKDSSDVARKVLESIRLEEALKKLQEKLNDLPLIMKKIHQARDEALNEE